MEKIIILSFLIFCIRTEPVDSNRLHQRIETSIQSELIPSQTRILSVQWNGKELIIDVSEEITSYGGGNAMEYAIASELASQVFSIPEVETFTLLIEGEEKYLPEGTRFLNYSRHQYMMEMANNNE